MKDIRGNVLSYWRMRSRAGTPLSTRAAWTTNDSRRCTIQHVHTAYRVLAALESTSVESPDHYGSRGSVDQRRLASLALPGIDAPSRKSCLHMLETIWARFCFRSHRAREYKYTACRPKKRFKTYKCRAVFTVSFATSRDELSICTEYIHCVQ